MTDPIFTAKSLFGGFMTVHAVDEDGDVLLHVTDNTGMSVIDLPVDDARRLGRALATIGAETRTEWTSRINYTDGRTHADGQPVDEDLARMASDGLNQVENVDYRALKGVDRSEPVHREVHTTADGWTHTGPWQVVDNASEVGLIGRAHAAALPAGPFDGWVECQAAGCPSTSGDLAAEDEMDDADGMAHGVQHHYLIDHWVVRDV